MTPFTPGAYMPYTPTNLLPDNVCAFEGGTTAWVAGANTATPTVLTTTPMTGAKYMRLTTVAAGSVTATCPRFAVTAGTQYVFRAPIRPGTAAAGRVFTLAVSWYSVSTGGTAISSNSSAVSMTSTTADLAANGAVLLATAPVGATFVAITLTVTGFTAASQFADTDDLYAGAYSPLHPGNLLDFNTEAMELNTSAWTVTANGTLNRAGGNLYPGSGYYTAYSQATAAGDVPIGMVTGTAITAGVMYGGYITLQTQVALAGFFEIRWYNGASALVATEQRTWTSTPSATIRLAAVGVAPVGAVTAKLFARTTATAGGQITFVDDAVLIPVTNPAGNLLTYEEYSTESILPAWTVTNGTTSRDALTSPLADGLCSLRVDGTSSGIITGSLDRLIPVTAGLTYQVGSTYVRHNSSALTITSASRTRVDWYDAGGVLLQADIPDSFFTISSSAALSATSYSETRTCPVGAAFAQVGFELDDSDPHIDYWLVDSVTLKEATPEYTLVTSDDTGLITFTVLKVPVTTGGLAAKVTVNRIDATGQASPMRGYGVEYTLAPYTAGTLVVEDYEAPLGANVWYSVTWYNSAGTTASDRLLTRTVPTPVLADGDYIWFKSPGLPALNTRVQMEAPVQWSRAARQARYEIVNRKNPVNVNGVRGGRQASITLLIWDESANEHFDALLDSGLPALVQAMPGYNLDGNVYLAVGDAAVEQLSPDAREPGWRWTLAVAEIDRPSGGLQGSAGSTWQSILDNPALTTWEDVFNIYGTWADVLTEG